MDQFFSKKVKEFDYSKEAILQHLRVLRSMEKLERHAKTCGLAHKGKRYSAETVRKNLEANDRLMLVELLILMFNEKNREKRHEKWKNIKQLLIRSSFNINFSGLRKMAKMWKNHKTIKDVKKTAA